MRTWVSGSMAGLEGLSFQNCRSLCNALVTLKNGFSAGALPKLHELNLAGCNFGNHDIEDLGKLGRASPQLKQLDLRFNAAISDASRAILTNELPALEILWKA